jgi:hypothetical protein
MKDARFKELLNLYLDQRLSAAEAAELEAGLREDPSRRRALRDYESMQSACSVLFSQVQSRAPSSEALRRALSRAEARIDSPRPVRDAWGWPTWGVTGGLAACVALVVARLSLPSGGLASAPASDAGAAAPSEGALILASNAPEVPAEVARKSMPRDLTFAALGISPETANANSVSQWILVGDETELFSTLEQATVAGEALISNWDAPILVNRGPGLGVPPGQAFSGTPIRVWTSEEARGGVHVEAVGYRFER